jgi:hypothetical protein
MEEVQMAENPNQHPLGPESEPTVVRVDKARIRQLARAGARTDRACSGVCSDPAELNARARPERGLGG